MIDNFLQRCLYKTVDFLNKAGIYEKEIELKMSYEEYRAQSDFNMKEYRKIIFDLSCSHTLPNTVVFCNCYKQSLIFLRNYSMIIDERMRKKNRVKNVVDYLGDTKDEFLMYLEAVVNDNNQGMLLKVVEKNEFFWDAYVLIENELNFLTKLSNLHRMFLVAEKSRIIEFDPNTENKNLLAAAYCVTKNNHISEEMFDKITNKPYFSLDYVDIYSNILHVNRSNKLSELVVKVVEMNRFRPETQIVMGNYFSSKNENWKAISHFQAAIKLNHKYSIAYTLIGHEYMAMKKEMNALKSYSKSIVCNPTDFKAWFGLGQAYGMLRMYQYSLLFYKRSVELRSDYSYVWIGLGSAYAKLHKEEAIDCFSRAAGLGDKEAILYSADFYKNVKKYNDAIKMYEKYVAIGGKETKRIKGFLYEYFKKANIKSKYEFYKDE